MNCLKSMNKSMRKTTQRSLCTSHIHQSNLILFLQKENMLSILVHLDVFEKNNKAYCGASSLVSLGPLTPSFFSLYLFEQIPLSPCHQQPIYPGCHYCPPRPRIKSTHLGRSCTALIALVGLIFSIPHKSHTEAQACPDEILAFCPSCCYSWNTPFLLSATPNPPCPWGLQYGVVTAPG